MLLGKNGRGHQHRRLLPPLDCLEGRTDGDLGLSVAHVSHKEPVHRIGIFHVRGHLGNGRKLIPCFCVGEGLLELAVQPVGLRKGEPLNQLPPGVALQQTPDFLLDPLPGRHKGRTPRGQGAAPQTGGRSIPLEEP